MHHRSKGTRACGAWSRTRVLYLLLLHIAFLLQTTGHISDLIWLSLPRLASHLFSLPPHPSLYSRANLIRAKQRECTVVWCLDRSAARTAAGSGWRPSFWSALLHVQQVFLSRVTLCLATATCPIEACFRHPGRFCVGLIISPRHCAFGPSLALGFCRRVQRRKGGWGSGWEDRDQTGASKHVRPMTCCSRAGGLVNRHRDLQRYRQPDQIRGQQDPCFRYGGGAEFALDAKHRAPAREKRPGVLPLRMCVFALSVSQKAVTAE